MSDNKPNKPEKPSRGEKHDKKDKVDKGGFASLFGTDGGEDGNGGRNWRSILLYLLIAAILVFLIFGVVNQGNSRDVHELATSEFVAAVDENRVHEATYSARLGTVEGTFWPKEDEVGDDEKLADYTSTYIGEDSLAELMAAHPDIVYKADVSSTPFWVSMLSSLLPMLLLIGVMVYFMNKFADPNSGAMQFGKTKAQTTDATRPKVKFDDVAGCDEAIEELKEIKDFLEDPDKYQEIGAKIPAACCSWALRVPVRPCLPRPWPARPACRSSRSRARALSRCSWAWAPRACATCSRRPRSRLPRSSSSTRSTPWAVSAVPAWAAATTNASRP